MKDEIFFTKLVWHVPNLNYTEEEVDKILQLRNWEVGDLIETPAPMTILG